MVKQIKTRGSWHRVIRAVIFTAIGLVLAVAVLIAAVLIFPLSKAGKVEDEAMRAGLTVDNLKPSDIDYFHDMDRGPKVPPGKTTARTTLTVRSSSPRMK